MIIGKRVRLRALEREDLPQYVRWLNDPEVIKGLLINLPLSLAKEEDWFDNVLKGPEAEMPLAIEVQKEGNWLHIGSISLQGINWFDRLAEVGVVIGEKAYWNQGFGRDAMNLMLRHGFNTLNLNRIYLRVYENNLRGIRSYEYAGFIHEGRMRQAKYQEGNYIDILIMGILRSEWKNIEV